MTRVVPRESEIQASILRLLRVLGIPAWRANTGAFLGEYQGRRRFVRFGPKGQADILGILPPDGRLLAIEVKRPGHHASHDQVAFLELVTHHGGLGMVVTSANEVKHALEHVRPPGGAA